MKCYFLFIIFVMCSLKLSAQFTSPDINRTNIWYFGFTHLAQAPPGLDFNSGMPVVLNNGRETGYGTSTLCNTQGALQMYPVSRGQGGYIINALQDTLQYSEGMFNTTLARSDNPQRFLCIPSPANDGIVYVFTTGISGNTATYEYSTVDMDLEGGLGSVIEKNHFLYLNPTGKQTAVHHENCHDIWVVSHEGLTNNFYAYLVTDTGVNDIPVISSIGAIIDPIGFKGDMELSPNGKKIAFTSKYFLTVQLFDFDNTTGLVSNPITLPTDSSGGEQAISFSPDGSKLYIGSSGRNLYQYNVLGDSASTVASRILIAVAPLGSGFYSMQIGPDGKMYIAKFSNEDDSLAIIHSPNSPGLACNFQDHAISLNGARSGDNLNNVIQSYFNEDPSAYKCFTAIGNELITGNDFVSVYPNPFTDKVTVSFNHFIKNCQIKLYDVSGREYISMKKTNVRTTEIYRDNLANGIYILKIQGEGFFYTGKLILGFDGASLVH